MIQKTTKKNVNRKEAQTMTKTTKKDVQASPSKQIKTVSSADSQPTIRFIQKHEKKQSCMNKTQDKNNLQAEKINIAVIREKALSLGLIFEQSAKKESIIRAIQVAEGYQSCYGTQQVVNCGQTGCLWRCDCQNQASAR